MSKKETKEVKELVFVCPECGGNKLGQTQNVLTCYPVVSIPDDGDLGYDSQRAVAIDGTTLGHNCWNCNYELTDKQGNPITDVLKIPAWIKENCLQTKEKND
jgi:hypothetical protein